MRRRGFLGTGVAVGLGLGVAVGVDVTDGLTGGGGAAVMNGRYSHAAKASISADNKMVSSRTDFTGMVRGAG